MAAAGVGLVSWASTEAQGKTPELGKIMFVGDSITHGYGSPSYRWPLHKILVDSGVKFTVVGVSEGNMSGGVEPGTTYAGVEFNNRHSAMSSERAYEVSGRINKSGRLGNSNIMDWLGLDKSYKGDFRLASSRETPDIFVMLIGTNDTLSDYGSKGGIGGEDGAHLKEVQEALLGKRKGARWSGTGDMDVIVNAMRKANRRARILVLSIPCWSGKGWKVNAEPEDFAAIAEYNQALQSWAEWKKVEWVDINPGLVDVSSTDKPGMGVEAFFNAKDKLHPAPQGDLLIAGNVANALGIGGRTLGAEVKPASQFEAQAEALFESATAREGVTLTDGTLELAPGKALQCPWGEAVTEDTGFTLEWKATVGNGTEDGWNPKGGLLVTIGAGGHTGTLLLSESLISWGGKPLYSSDMSQEHRPLRVAWLKGDEEQGLQPGFYVWLGSQLIGEALPDDKKPMQGLRLQNATDSPVQVSRLSVGSGIWAPASPVKKKLDKQKARQ